MHKLLNNQLTDLNNQAVFDEVAKRVRRHLKTVNPVNIDWLLSMNLLTNNFREELLSTIEFKFKDYHFATFKQIISIKFNSKYVAVKDIDVLYIFEAKTGQPIKQIKLNKCAFTFANNHFYLIADNRLVIYDNFEIVDVRAIDFTPDDITEDLVIYGSNYIGQITTDNLIIKQFNGQHPKHYYEMDYGGYQYIDKDNKLHIRVYQLEFNLVRKALKLCDNDVKFITLVKESKTYLNLDPVLKSLF